MSIEQTLGSPNRKKGAIPPPVGDKEPLKRNVYEFVQFTKTALAPMFPYFDEGSIVPCTAIFRGGPDVDYGRFQHFNTVDEVLLTFGARGSQRGGGTLRVGAKPHMVQSPLSDTANPENLALAVITQRQSIGKPQKEEFRFVCEKCDSRLFLASFDATPARRGGRRKASGARPVFATIPETYKAARAFNADETVRTCKHCGHENKPFPVEVWGWRHYVEQLELSEAARGTMRESQEAPRGEGPAVVSNRRERR